MMLTCKTGWTGEGSVNLPVIFYRAGVTYSEVNLEMTAKALPLELLHSGDLTSAFGTFFLTLI